VPGLSLVTNFVPGRVLRLIALAQPQLQVVVTVDNTTVVIHAKMIAKIAAAKTVWATAAQLWIVRLPQTPTVKMAVVKSTASVKSWLTSKISLNP
jgi:hypothetical protein